MFVERQTSCYAYVWLFFDQWDDLACIPIPHISFLLSLQYNDFMIMILGLNPVWIELLGGIFPLVWLKIGVVVGIVAEPILPQKIWKHPKGSDAKIYAFSFFIWAHYNLKYIWHYYFVRNYLFYFNLMTEWNIYTNICRNMKFMWYANKVSLTIYKIIIIKKTYLTYEDGL